MTTPEDRFYNPARINFWFAVSAVLACAGAAGAILKDYADRDWKSYQEGFFSLEKANAGKALALKDAKFDGETAAVQQAARSLVWVGGAEGGEILDPAAFEGARAAAREEDEFQRIAAHAARLYLGEAEKRRGDEAMQTEASRLRAASMNAENARFRAEMDKKGLQSDVDERKNQMEHARNHGHDAEADALEEKYHALVAKEAEVHAVMDARALEKLAADEALKAVLAPVTSLEARADVLFDDALVGPAERRLTAFQFAMLRDAPFMEVLAPVKRIQQRVYKDLPIDLPFGSVPRVDRCETCHMGIAKVSVSPETGEVLPLYTAENTPERVYRTHPRPELFVSSSSPHPIEKVGCTICHDGLGLGLSFNSAYHMPSDEKQEHEWKEKYHWHKGESWEFPQLPLRHIEASCAKCHRDVKDTESLYAFRKDIPGAPQWNEGKRIVERSGCYACHKIDGYSVAGLDKEVLEDPDARVRAQRLASSMRKPGPSLGRIAAKLPSREVAFKWIWNPKSLRPTSPMPRIFGLANNSGIDPVTGHDYDVRTRTEVWGIVEYLWANSQEWAVKVPGTAASAARGKEVVGSVGCLACHGLADFPSPEGGRANDHGPDLSTVGSRVTKAWLYGWLRDPAHYWANTAMPSLRLTEQEALDVAEYLFSLKAPADSPWTGFTPAAASDAAVLDLAREALGVGALPGKDFSAAAEALSPEERLHRVGRRAIERYGCFGCHDIPGFEQKDRIGTQLGGDEGWGSKDVDRLDYGVLENAEVAERYAAQWGAERIPHRRPDWARMKLRNPRVFDAGITKKPGERLLMPQFDFTESEVDAATTFLLSLQIGEVPLERRPRPDVEDREADRMRWVARKFNCTGCHTLDRHEVVLEDGTREWQARGGDLRPWLNRDAWPPTLGGEGRARTPDERAAHEARARGEAAKLKALRPWEFPNPVGEGTKAQPAWLFRFLHDPGREVLRPWLATRMPTFPFTETELNILVRGFAAADCVPFPYALENGRPLSDVDRADADALFKALQCASCHPTAGAGFKPGEGGLAPDLALGHDRLRREWILLWLDDPALLQPGTRMPPFWRTQGYLSPPPGLPREFFGSDSYRQMERISDFVLGLGAPKGAKR